MAVTGMIAWVDRTALTTTQAAKVLGTSRQHVADLADRGELPCWKVGTHRRFQRQNVVAYRDDVRRSASDRTYENLNLTDRRSLAFGLLIGERLVISPEDVLRRAWRNLDKLRLVHSDGSADIYFNRWSELLVGPIDGLLKVLSSIDDESVALRHASPFAGLLTETDRRAVIQATRRSAA